MARLMNIGFGNVVNTGKIVSVLNPDSAPAKRLIQRAKEEDTLVDATQGRRTRAIIITDANILLLSALLPDTLAGRFNDGNGAEERHNGE